MTDPEDNTPIPPPPKEREEVGNRPNSPDHDTHGSLIDPPVLTPGNLEEPNSRDSQDDPDDDADDGNYDDDDDYYHEDDDYDDDDDDDDDDHEGRAEPKGHDQSAGRNSVAGDGTKNAGELPSQNEIPRMVQSGRRRPIGGFYGPAAPGYPSSAGILRDKFGWVNPFAPTFRNYGHPNDDPEQTGAWVSEDHTEFEELLRRRHGPSVIYSTEDAITVNIASLQRVCLDRLRKELAHQAFEFKYLRGNVSSVLSNSLVHQYVEMLKDYDYMKQCALKGEQEDPFVISPLNDEDMTLLLKVQDEFSMKWSTSTPFRFLVSEFDKDTNGREARAAFSEASQHGDSQRCQQARKGRSFPRAPGHGVPGWCVPHRAYAFDGAERWQADVFDYAVYMRLCVWSCHGHVPRQRVQRLVGDSSICCRSCCVCGNQHWQQQHRGLSGYGYNCDEGWFFC